MFGCINLITVVAPPRFAYAKLVQICVVGTVPYQELCKELIYLPVFSIYPWSGIAYEHIGSRCFLCRYSIYSVICQACCCGQWIGNGEFPRWGEECFLLMFFVYCDSSLDWPSFVQFRSRQTPHRVAQTAPQPKGVSYSIHSVFQLILICCTILPLTRSTIYVFCDVVSQAILTIVCSVRSHNYSKIVRIPWEMDS